MIATQDLIGSLAANLSPVRRLSPPLLRAAGWLGLAAIVLVLLSIVQGTRPDLLQRLHEPGFAISIAAAALTGALAALAAFAVSVPGRSRLWMLLPLPALAVWLGSVGAQCLTHWVPLDTGSIGLAETARCFATLVLTSLPLSLAMLLMQRHVAVLQSVSTTLMGSLAVAAVTAAALPLFHAFDATLMILIWNFGTGALILAVGGIVSWRLTL